VEYIAVQVLIMLRWLSVIEMQTILNN